MFNNNITQTYTNQDASIEIIIMLAGSFLLGSLLTWLIRELLQKDKHNIQYSTHENHFSGLKDSNHSVQSSRTPAVAKVIHDKSELTYRTPRIDDLTKLSGIDVEIQNALKNEGVNSFTDLRDIKTQTLKAIQQGSPAFTVNKKEIETWPHQASLAAKGDWKKLKEYQSFIQRAQTAMQNVETSKPANADDLKVIEGIGPKIEEILNNKGIYTFRELSNSDSMLLKKYIVEADMRFENNETESWPHQAGMAEKGQWEELNIYQEFMHSESSLDSDSNPDVSKIIDYTAKEETENLEDHDDLKKIEGIGPKIEEVLNKSGIYTFRQLYNSDRNRLKTLLNEAGNQFKMHDPESWPHQAGMADRGEWDDLRIYQEFMDGGRDITSSSASPDLDDSTDSDKNIINKNDDLKKIEGIGPKIEALLNSHNINTYSDLSKSSRDIIKKYLDEGGPQYRVHEPESWPKQAKLASEGSWEELDKLQEKIVNSR
jgi:predicted flap endonuclease-1-like 5' DNA nuclease